MQMLIPFVAFAVTLILLTILLRTRFFAGIKDIPNHRSLHVQPIPRIGGLALMAGVVAAYGMLYIHPLWNIGIPAIFLAVVSFADDIWSLPAMARFSAHLVAALMFANWGVESIRVDILAILMVTTLVWIINLYNFMDGIDGLAGGMATCGFCVYGAAALLAHNSDLAIVSFSIAASALAFLLYNFHPAKVFLGDVGSIPLGFAAGSLGILGWDKNIWPVWFPILVFSPFIVDASFTLMKRLSRRERVWEGHQDHYYQRMVRMGWGHRKTALVEYVMMICAGVTAFMALNWSQSMRWTLLVTCTFVYIGVAFAIDRAWRRHRALTIDAD